MRESAAGGGNAGYGRLGIHRAVFREARPSTLWQNTAGRGVAAKQAVNAGIWQCGVCCFQFRFGPAYR